VKKILLLAMLFSTMLACQDDASLSYCPALQPCTVSEDNKVILLNESSPDYEFYNVGECSVGLVECVADEIICVDYYFASDEICDGLDNNCDGTIDEGYDKDGDSYTTCNGDCNDYDNLIHPNAPEICDGLDNDCDGVLPNNEIDNDLDTYTECEGDCDDTKPEINPGALEICDGLDNDCDGLIDEEEELAEICGPDTALGVCEYGTEVCLDGEESVCVGAIYPQNEICDGFDNDCNGDKDDGLFRPCATICGGGLETCYDGGWYDCTAPIPSEEICDGGLDNDCDGLIDEGCLCNEGDITGCAESPMYDPQTNEIIDPPCGMGIKICDITGTYGPCYFFDTLPEECNNWDDNCDGVIDGMTDYCTSDPDHVGVGECVSGLKECTAGQWSECEGQVFPEDEICDGLDNDCDGDIDEDLEPHEKVDLLFVIDISGSMQSYINALAAALSAYVSDFEQTEHKFGLVVFPNSFFQHVGAEFDVRSGTLGNALINVNAFQNLINSLYANAGGLEPSYDVAKILMTSSDAGNIGWRDDAYPYVIIITDEQPQSWSNYDVYDVAQNSLNCHISSCESGDAYEFYIISKAMYEPMWTPALPSSDNYKYLPYSSSGFASYIEILRDIFKNACL